MSKRPAPSLQDTGIPRAKKGQAAPATDFGAPARPPKDKPAGDARPTQAGAREETLARAQAAQTPTPSAEPEPRAAMRLMPRKAQARGEPRSPVTTRLTYALQDRLFAAATHLSQTQQAIIEDAIDAYLARHGL